MMGSFTKMANANWFYLVGTAPVENVRKPPTWEVWVEENEKMMQSVVQVFSG